MLAPLSVRLPIESFVVVGPSLPRHSVYDYHQDVQYIYLVTDIAKHIVKEYIEIIKLCQK